MNILSIILSIIAVLLLSYQLYYIRKLNVELRNRPSNEDSFDKSQLTSYELERLEREEEFDKRINRLKEELAKQQTIIRRGTIADEFHPMVKNLPHDVIKINQSLPDIEVAD